MKKFIFVLTLVLSFVTLCNAQPKHGRFHFKNVYTQVDTITIENVTVPTEWGDYLVELPKQSNLIIAYNKDYSKAIVLHTDYRFVKHFEYNVKDNEVRTILWYKDKHIYCGYIYDKKSKTGHYFEAIDAKEKEQLVTCMPFLKYAPTFNNE